MSFSTYATLYVYCTILLCPLQKNQVLNMIFFISVTICCFFAATSHEKTKRTAKYGLPAWSSLGVKPSVCGLPKTGYSLKCWNLSLISCGWTQNPSLGSSHSGRVAGKSQSHSGVTRTAKESFNLKKKVFSNYPGSTSRKYKVRLCFL